MRRCCDPRTTSFDSVELVVRARAQRSPGGPARLRNHLVGTIAIDFLTVPTVTFDIVYVFFVLSLERRRVLHVNVTMHPHAAWAARQIVEAIGADVAPVLLVRDRDAIFGTAFDGA